MKLNIPIDVIPQGRPRFYNGIAIDPPKSKQFKTELAMLVKSLRRGSALLDGAIKIELGIYRQASKFKKGVTSKKYGDIDNLAKAILDAFNGVIWQDDSQIVDLHITKNLADVPMIKILIEEVK